MSTLADVLIIFSIYPFGFICVPIIHLGVFVNYWAIGYTVVVVPMQVMVENVMVESVLNLILKSHKHSVTNNPNNSYNIMD